MFSTRVLRIRWYVFMAIFMAGLMAYGILQLSIVKKRLMAPAVYDTSKITQYVAVKISDAPTQEEAKVVIKPIASQGLLPGATWVPQTFNNCGPATTSMVLQYFGYHVDQKETQAHLRTNPDDKNVFTTEMRDYLKKDYNVNSRIFYNGTPDRLKLLISNGFYVVVEDWLHPGEDIGHVTIIKGYDDEKGGFIADDSYLGINIIYQYTKFDTAQWKPFNRQYMPVYRGEQEEFLKAIVGEDWDETAMYQTAVKVNRADVDRNPNDMYAWFNLGTSYYALKDYENARNAFEKSQSIGWPHRMLWYQIQPVQTYNALGEYQRALELTKIGLAGNETFAELHFESAVAYKGLGNEEQAAIEIEKTLQYAPNYVL